MHTSTVLPSLAGVVGDGHLRQTAEGARFITEHAQLSVSNICPAVSLQLACSREPSRASTSASTPDTASATSAADPAEGTAQASQEGESLQLSTEPEKPAAELPPEYGDKDSGQSEPK